MPFDVIVIGSGFGGAITSCRLAQAKKSVLVLERGREWGRNDFPRAPDDGWRWDHADPKARHGWLGLRLFPHMAVAQGAGVGGGSLIYASVSCEAPEAVFDSGWPAPVTYAELKPHYDRVAKVMGVNRVPPGQTTDRMRLMKEAAAAIGAGDRYRDLELAITFNSSLPPGNIGRTHPASVIQKENDYNANQGYCVHCGECDIGCKAGAKNTLDVNYLSLARKSGATIRPLSLVRRIEAAGSQGYRVTYDDLGPEGQAGRAETAAIVILAAGSLGSTELLLRARDVDGTLPAIGPRLGKGWSANGDFLTPAFYIGRPVNADIGPTIGSAIDFQDGSVDGKSFWIQDGGFPNILIGYLQAKIDDPSTDIRTRLLLKAFEGWMRQEEPLRGVMPWFAQGVDAGDGTLTMTADGRLQLDWNVARSAPLIDAIADMHKLLSRKTGGIPLVPPTWTLFRDLVTPHPLGGCNMGSDAGDGVVDGLGQVFGHPNLYVADGAVVPRPLGVNPSRTIGALAEHIAANIVRRLGGVPASP